MKTTHIENASVVKKGRESLRKLNFLILGSIPFPKTPVKIIYSHTFSAQSGFDEKPCPDPNRLLKESIPEHHEWSDIKRTTDSAVLAGL